MANRLVLFGCLLALISTSAPAKPQPAAHPPAQPKSWPPPSGPISVPRSQAPCSNITPGTPVEIEINEDVSSEVNKTGDRFQITLVRPIRVDSITTLPEGITGQGEVILAHKAGLGVKPGYLLVEGRFLDFYGVLIPLTGFKTSSLSDSQVESGDPLAIAALSGVANLASRFIKGREIVISAGTRATVKVAQPNYNNQYCIPIGYTSQRAIQ